MRRTRIDLLLEGVTALETVYRDALARSRARAQPRSAARACSRHRAAAAALDACREAREAFLINEKGLVRLTHLLLSLPPAGRAELQSAERRAADPACYAVASVAGVAQTVEQLTRNEQARSSSLLSGSHGSAGQPHRDAMRLPPEDPIARRRDLSISYLWIRTVLASPIHISAHARRICADERPRVSIRIPASLSRR